MGRYTSMPLVTGRYPSAATKGGSTDQENYFIVGAEDELDGTLAVRYTVPMSPAPGYVIDLATDMAYLKMKPGDKELRKAVDARLEALRNGDVTLVVSGSVLDQSNFAWAEANRHSSFGPDDPVNWSVDSGWIQEAQDERL